MNADNRPGERHVHRLQSRKPDQGWSWRGLLVAAAAGLGAFSVEQFWPVTHDLTSSTAGQMRAVQTPGVMSVANERPEQPGLPGIAVPKVEHQSHSVGDLVLVATSPGSNPATGTAQLGVYPRNAQTYAAGALLLNGVRLEQIYPDHVVLEHDGRRAELFLSDVIYADRAGANPLLHFDAPQPSQPAASNGDSAHSDVLKSAELTDYIRPNPVFDRDRLRGFEVYPGAQPAVFAQLGLIAGDVVVAVNGVSATDFTQIADVFQELTGGGTVEATVDRRGMLERIVLDGAVIAQARRQVQQSAALAETNSPSLVEMGAK